MCPIEQYHQPTWVDHRHPRGPLVARAGAQVPQGSSADLNLLLKLGRVGHSSFQVCSGSKPEDHPTPRPIAGPQRSRIV